MKIGIACIVIGGIGLLLQIMSSIGHSRNAAMGGFAPVSTWSPIGTISIIIIIIGIIAIVVSNTKNNQ